MTPRETAPRVLLLAPHHPPDQGAAAARLSSFADRLRGLGHEVRVVAPRPSYLVPSGATDVEAGKVETAGEPVRWVDVARRERGVLGNAAHQWRLALALRRGAREELAGFRADVVLASSPPPVAALAAMGLGPPVVLDVRDTWPDVLVEAGALGETSLAAGALRVVGRRLAAGATALITPTRVKRERLARRHPTRPVFLVPNGVEDEWLDAPLASPRAASPFVVTCAGNVGLAQDVGLLVRALAELERRRPGAFRGAIIGEGERMPEVRALAAELGAPVDFAGVESRDEVRRRLRECGCAHVSLRTASLVDAVPSKLLEAMAAGAVVVLAAAGEAAEILEASGAGFVVPPGDVAALARALERAAGLSAEERAELGRRGREHVAAHYRRASAAIELSRALHEVAGFRSAGSGAR